MVRFEPAQCRECAGRDLLLTARLCPALGSCGPVVSGGCTPPHRPQVWKIEDFLSKWEAVAAGAAGGGAGGAAPAKGADDAAAAAIGAILLSEIDSYRWAYRCAHTPPDQTCWCLWLCTQARVCPSVALAAGCSRRLSCAPSTPHRRRRCLPHLKTCLRGAGWEDDHWAQLFALLGLKAGALTKEGLTLALFLDRADAVAAAADAIRALDAQVRVEGRRGLGNSGVARVRQPL